jgi:hypothetical protein
MGLDTVCPTPVPWALIIQLLASVLSALAAHIEGNKETATSHLDAARGLHQQLVEVVGENNP